MQLHRPFVEFELADINQTIAERFEQQAQRYPTRLAVKGSDRACTYDELNRTANRIGRAVLDRAEQRAAAPVALFFRGAKPTILAGLAVMKAGRAYAPVDAQLPELKARQILASLDSPLVLTDDKHFSAAVKMSGHANVLNIDKLGPNFSSDNLEVSTSPDSAAYINFTSGSTGEPKGVVWNHRSELFGIRTKTNTLRIAGDDRVSLLRSNNVGATRDMYLALLNGATLVTPDLHENELVSLAGWLAGEEITVFSCVATIFRQAVHSARVADDFGKIRLVHIGGEPIFKTDVASYRRYFPDDCLFVSRYSISETQAVSYFFIDKQTEITEERVPVGYPLDGSEILVLDEDGHGVGAGETGEIAIRSRYLALGYWRRPELTRAKFRADSRDPGVRTYLTGDLGYRLPDGCLVHVGRKDFQAKIRGHRVEVTAVETALHEIARIKQAVVVGRQDARGGDRLIAYVVREEAAMLTVKQLRAELSLRLPSYMMPAAFVFVQSLPVNSAGKIDRPALPAPQIGGHNIDESSTARNAVEKVLLNIWRAALKIDSLGIHDDFIEIGGDSLLGAQIAAHVNDSFALAAPLGGLFHAPTVARLAEWLTEQAAPGQAEKIALILLHIDSMSDAAILAAIGERKPGS